MLIVYRALTHDAMALQSSGMTLLVTLPVRVRVTLTDVIVTTKVIPLAGFVT